MPQTWYVAKAVLELLILQPVLPKCQDYRLYHAQIFFPSLTSHPSEVLPASVRPFMRTDVCLSLPGAHPLDPNACSSLTDSSGLRPPHLAAASCVARAAEASGPSRCVLAGCLVPAGAGQDKEGTVGRRSRSRGVCTVKQQVRCGCGEIVEEGQPQGREL